MTSRRMNGTLQRKGIVGTIGDAVAWLQRTPPPPS
jgi:hypothetical protein